MKEPSGIPRILEFDVTAGKYALTITSGGSLASISQTIDLLETGVDTDSLRRGGFAGAEDIGADEDDDLDRGQQATDAGRVRAALRRSRAACTLTRGGSPCSASGSRFCSGALRPMT